MKKILKLSIAVLIISIFAIENVFALECNTSIKSQKSEYKVNEEVKVDFYISEIKSNRGVISLQGILEYDEFSLTLIKMEGKNGWDTPTDGSSFNKKNGKFAIVRSGVGKKDEVMLSLTFKVKEGAKQNPIISLKNVAIADGEGMAKFASISKTITIKKENPTTTQSSKSDIEEDKDITVPIVEEEPEKEGTTARITSNIKTTTTTKKITSSSETKTTTKTNSKENKIESKKNNNIWIIIGAIIIVGVIVSSVYYKSKNK